MKSSELRIGNFVNQIGFSVQDGYPPNYKKLDQIKEAKQIDFSVYMEPIPLTEEWLLKFGFERTDLIDNSNDDWTWLFYQKDSIYIDGSDLTIETATGIVIKVEYVHQLQNLYFALTNEELTFKSE